MRIIRTKGNRLKIGIFGHNSHALKRFVRRSRLLPFEKYITVPVHALPDFGGHLAVYEFPNKAELRLFKLIYAIENRNRIGKDERPELNMLPKVSKRTREAIRKSRSRAKKAYKLRCRRDRHRRWHHSSNVRRERLKRLLQANKQADLYAKARAAAREAVVADLFM